MPWLTGSRDPNTLCRSALGFMEFSYNTSSTRMIFFKSICVGTRVMASSSVHFWWELTKSSRSSHDVWWLMKGQVFFTLLLLFVVFFFGLLAFQLKIDKSLKFFLKDHSWILPLDLPFIPMHSSFKSFFLLRNYLIFGTYRFD